jgi:hypothetical protein
MQLVLRYTHRRRPIISLPFAIGMLQGLLLEQLPNNLFTITRAQVNRHGLWPLTDAYTDIETGRAIEI